MKNLFIRLKAYKPNGDTLGLLPQPSSFSASFLHDDTGALRLEYSRKALNGSILERKLETGLEIAVEVSDGGKWLEPLNGRFVLISRSRDALDSSDTVTFTCPSYAWLLNKALMLDLAHLEGDGDDKGKRVFKKASAGLIMRTFLDENKTRGGIPVTCGFDTGRDSAGAAWKSAMTLAYTPGISSLTALANLASNKICDWAFDKRTLKIWNMDSTALCRDLSRISVQLAHDVLEAPEEESIEALASHILVQGDNNKAFTRDNPAAPAPWGKWETYLSQQGISDDDTAALYMQSTLDTAARVRGQYTRALRVNDAPNLPLIDWRPGDWITAPTVMHGEKVRVQQVTLSLESNQFKASVVLNDKVYDATVRQAKRVQGITGGAINGGTGGGIPAPEKDHRTPKAVTGLVVATDAYISSRGTALGLATLQWAAVSQATDNTAIDISSYRVEYRKNTAGAPWVSGGVTDAQRLTLGIGGLECGQRYEFRVRAVPTYSDKFGDWSNVVVALVASDVTPPSIPSKPILTSKLGVVDVRWDGRNNAGDGMELDFDHVEVGISDSNGNWKYRDSVARDGHCVVTGLEYRVYWFALRSVDHSGNKSDWGVGASITVASAVSQADLDRLDKDLRDNKQQMANAQKDLSQAKSDIAGNTTAIGNMNKQLTTAKSDLTQAKSDIANNKTAISNANQQIASNKTAIDNANRELTQAKSDLTQAKKDVTQAKSDAADAKAEAGKANVAIESAKTDIAIAASKAQSALDKANSVGKSLDGLHNVYEGPDDPTTLSGVTVRQGDFWYRTQKYWTRWSGAANDSTSLLADFYTYWLGEPNNSASVLVPLSSRFIGVYVWDGSRWNERNIVAANILASGSVVASNMAANSITTEKLVAGAITTDKVAANAIVAGKIASGAITTDKLAALAVTADKLAANSVVAGKLAANSVDAGNIVAGAVTVDKLAANSVDASKIVAGAISTDKLAALAVTADKLAANSVVAGKLAANSVNAGNIVSGAITTEKLAALAVTVDKLAADSVDASKIVAQSVTGDRIASNTIVARNIAAQSITSDRIAAGQFAGYVFTGSIFRTSGSNPKVEMTSSGIHVTNSSGQDVLRIGYGVETGLSVMNPYNSKEMVPLTYQAFSQMAYKEQTKQYKTYIKRFDSFDNYESKQDYDNIINLNFVTTKSGKVLIDFETFYSLFVDAILDNRSSPAASVTITAYADYYVKIMNKSGAIKFDDGFLFKNTTVMAFAYKPKSNSAVGNESYRRVVNLDPFQLYSLEVYGSIRFKLSAANNPVFPPRTSDFENYCSGNINGTSISVTPLADS
ncbi:Permease protein of ABC transporter system [Bifidobacterium breve JCM 7019]|uniref:fibronectin n=1 Tax=Bifidobacterium breve TaxID=1685 RepID=UPI0003EFD4E6|nr:fibronectin [Bifidobacterium breve]AHJ19193.1 Permease protein of ABC transporter system [Bifidobacterium breve JCM 7019]